MANIAIQKNGTETTTTTQLQPMRAWDPFRVMREWMRMDPFQELAPPWPAQDRSFYAPAFEVKETKTDYVFKADMPGVAEKDLEVTLEGNLLTVAGKRESEQQDKNDTYHVYERSFGSFTRSFSLPDGVDASHIVADLREGVLTLTVPKRPEVQPKKIPVGGKPSA